jgi:hypothetical protein
MFQDSHTFLDLDFESTQDISELLRRLHCTSFLSEQVTIKTEPCQPLLLNDDLTKDYRIRGLAIKRCVHTKMVCSHLITVNGTTDILTIKKVTRDLS